MNYSVRTHLIPGVGKISKVLLLAQKTQIIVYIMGGPGLGIKS